MDEFGNVKCRIRKYFKDNLVVPVAGTSSHGSLETGMPAPFLTIGKERISQGESRTSPEVLCPATRCNDTLHPVFLRTFSNLPPVVMCTMYKEYHRNTEVRRGAVGDPHDRQHDPRNRKCRDRDCQPPAMTDLLLAGGWVNQAATRGRVPPLRLNKGAPR